MEREALNEFFRTVSNGHSHAKFDGGSLGTLADMHRDEHPSMAFDLEQASRHLKAAEELLDKVLVAARGIVPSDTTCPACSGRSNIKYNDLATVYRCLTCSAIHGECSEHVSYSIVSSEWDTGNPPAEQWVYYDLRCRTKPGSPNFRFGGFRRHGWFNPATKKIVQVG